MPQENGPLVFSSGDAVFCAGLGLFSHSPQAFEHLPVSVAAGAGISAVRSAGEVFNPPGFRERRRPIRLKASIHEMCQTAGRHGAFCNIRKYY